MASVIFWAVLGGLVGAFAKLVLWDKEAETWMFSMLVSLAGGIAGGFAGSTLGGLEAAGVPAGFGLASMILAVAGAGVALLVYHAFVGRKHSLQSRSTARSTAA